MALIIKWNRRAMNQFDEAIEYIENDSLANAEKVKEEILLKIDSLSQHPEKYNPDKYKTKMTAASGLLNYTITGYRIVIQELKSELSEYGILKRVR
jgi:plasmid stabilization system protein ParE